MHSVEVLLENGDSMHPVCCRDFQRIVEKNIERETLSEIESSGTWKCGCGGCNSQNGLFSEVLKGLGMKGGEIEGLLIRVSAPMETSFASFLEAVEGIMSSRCPIYRLYL